MPWPGRGKGEAGPSRAGAQRRTLAAVRPWRGKSLIPPFLCLCGFTDRLDEIGRLARTILVGGQLLGRHVRGVYEKALAAELACCERPRFVAVSKLVRLVASEPGENTDSEAVSVSTIEVDMSGHDLQLLLLSRLVDAHADADWPNPDRQSGKHEAFA